MEAREMRINKVLGLALAATLAAGVGACSKEADDHAGGEPAASAEAGKTAEKVVVAEVVELPSGLKYEVVESGSGASPKLTDKVTVHYRGTLTDGTEFDSSYKRGQPAQFPVNRVIAGWTEALQLMKEGDKWKLTIPPNLAYGAQGAGSAIPPNATLLFEVELIKVN